MVQFIGRPKSFGDQIAEGIGQGASQGIQQMQQMMMQIEQEKIKNKQRQDLFNQIESGGMPSSKQDQGDIREKFLSILPQLEEAVGRELSPQDLDKVWSAMNDTQKAPEQPSKDSLSKAKKYAALGEHDLSRVSVEEAKMGEKRKSEQTKLAFAETKDYRTHIADQSRAAEELDPVLIQMEHLIKKGKLTNPVIAKLADKFGLVGLLDPSSQQFQGLSVGFLNNAKNIFGARLTNLDVQTYLDKIPRLAQTDAGKQALIDNFKTLGEAAKIRNKEKNKIIKENNGIPPLDLEEQVSERSSSKMDSLFDKFNKSFYETSRTGSGKILMRNSDGTLGEVDEGRVQEAIKKGYKLE